MYITTSMHPLRQRAFCGDSSRCTCSRSLILSTYHLTLVRFRLFYHFVPTCRYTVLDLRINFVASNQLTPPWLLLPLRQKSRSLRHRLSNHQSLRASGAEEHRRLAQQTTASRARNVIANVTGAGHIARHVWLKARTALATRPL